MGGTKYRGLWGKGRLAAVVDGVFLRVGGTKWGPVGTGGALSGVRIEPEGLGRLLGGAVSEGTGGASGREVGKAEECGSCFRPPPKGSHCSRVTPALCEENSAGFTSGLCAVGVIVGRGRGSDGAVLSEEAL